MYAILNVGNFPAKCILTILTVSFKYIIIADSLIVYFPGGLNFCGQLQWYEAVEHIRIA